MRMLNRAIEDAADASEFIKKLQECRDDQLREAKRLQGESRTDRRARERAERKAAIKAQSKVKA